MPDRNARARPSRLVSMHFGLGQIAFFEIEGLARQLPSRAVAQRERPSDVRALVRGGRGAQASGERLAGLHGDGRQRREIELLPVRAWPERSGRELYPPDELRRPPERKAVDLGGTTRAPDGFPRARRLVATIRPDLVPRPGCLSCSPPGACLHTSPLGGV